MCLLKQRLSMALNIFSMTRVRRRMRCAATLQAPSMHTVLCLLGRRRPSPELFIASLSTPYCQAVSCHLQTFSQCLHLAACFVASKWEWTKKSSLLEPWLKEEETSSSKEGRTIRFSRVAPSLPKSTPLLSSRSISVFQTSDPQRGKVSLSRWNIPWRQTKKRKQK